ncbi:MAG: 4Fe-4S dicluster domain-containing protein [Candidatus ainarchaeum sp.]|nr:4Fe-4S dicluster domain-containing protein [Candidatus ainarchaeum sp.]
MPIAINYKICDNSPDCLGIIVCPTKAFFFDKKKKTLVVNNKKCISCGKCVLQCEVSAIKFSKSKDGLKKIREEIKNDKRKRIDLFVDRYGSEPQSKIFFCQKEKFDLQIIQSTKPTIVECFVPDSIHCLVKSIPIKNLLKNKNVVFRKFLVEDKKFEKKFLIKKYPCLLFFDKGKFFGKIEGYFSIDDEEVLLTKINKLL